MKHLLGKSNSVVANTEVSKALYSEAIIDSNEAIRLDAEVAAYYHTRGAVSAAMGESIRAIEDFDSAIELDPKYANAYFNRSLAKEILGQQDAAKVDYEIAKELDPDVGKRIRCQFEKK